VTRAITAAAESALDSARSDTLHLFEAEFSGGTVYATDAPFPIAWNGNTYPALGHLLSYDGLEENADLREARVGVSLSGVDQVYISAVLAENYLDRPLRVYRAFLDGQGGVIVDPFALFEGVMDFPEIAEDPHAAPPAPGLGTCTVTVEASSHWADFGRRPGRHTNDNEQQFHFPGDKFFEFVSEQNRTFQWGSAILVARKSLKRFDPYSDTTEFLDTGGGD
jgi:hypothetical protein